MSDESTIRMIELYNEEAEAPMFLAEFFKSPARNFHNTEEVEIDILRDDEDVAVVIQDLTVAPRSNQNNVFTNKLFVPPIYDEELAITAFNLIKRQPGVDPFQDPNFGANALREAFSGFAKLERKIRRAIELQASQVLQSGVLTLTDGAGNTLFSLDFSPKSTHFVTVAADWAADGTTGDPLADLESLSNVIRRDGKKRPDRLIFGADAMNRFLANPKVIEELNFRRAALIDMAPVDRGNGATFRGTIRVGHYMMEMWMYDGFFSAPTTGTPTPYVGEDRVIMLSSDGRLDLTFGSIPLLASPESRALPFLPSQIRSTDRGMALTTNSWLTPNNKALMVSAGTRPLCIPTALDTFGALDVVA